MTAGEHEAGLLMTCEIESRRMKCGLVVALLATVEVGCACELVAVYVLVAGRRNRIALIVNTVARPAGT